MGYADGLLTSGESIIHREKQHWWVFIWGAKFTILAVIAALLIIVIANGMETTGFLGTLKTILGWVAAAVFIGGFALLVWTTLRYINQEYVVTNRRVMETTGVINKRAADSSLEKINDAVLTQSIFGRALGFGDLKILTASEAAISEFKMIRRPIEFKKAMLEAKHGYELEVSGAGRAAPPSPPMRAEAPAPMAPPAAAAVAAPPQPAVAAPPPAAAAPVSPSPAAPVGDETVVSTVPGGPPPTAPLSAAPSPAAPPPAAPTPAAMEPDELTRTLASLADLRDRGAISAEEYERKKAEILSRL